jgi:hypothetical protein
LRFKLVLCEKPNRLRFHPRKMEKKEEGRDEKGRLTKRKEIGK